MSRKKEIIEQIQTQSVDVPQARRGKGMMLIGYIFDLIAVFGLVTGIADFTAIGFLGFAFFWGIGRFIHWWHWK